MPKLLSRLYRGAKRRIKQGLRDHRTSELYRAANRLLIHHDHEQVSVSCPRFSWTAICPTGGSHGSVQYEQDRKQRCD